MMLEQKELLEIRGGAITATWLNSVARIISSVIEVGRMIGSSFRRLVSKSYCKF